MNDYQTLRAMSRKYRAEAEVCAAQSRHREQAEFRALAEDLRLLANKHAFTLDEETT